MSEFYLKNKDEIVVSMDFSDDEIKDYEIIKQKLLPKGIKESSFKKDFANWIVYRISRWASGNWQNGNALLSLNDCYCVLSARDERSWDELSLYRNAWDEKISAEHFLGHGFSLESRALNPSFCTDGALPKCWIKAGNKQYLLKYTLGMGDQTRGEFLAYQVAKALGLECVEYELCEHLGKLASKCESFCDEKIGFVAIHRLLDNFESYKKCAFKARELFGAERFDDMIIFDALIANKDRHYGNFGFLVDNETNELLRPAPIFDSGYCAFRYSPVYHAYHKAEFNELKLNAMYEQNRTFGTLMGNAVLAFGSDRHIKMLEKLYDFSFKGCEFISNCELAEYESFVRNNARNIIRVIESKNF